MTEKRSFIKGAVILSVSGILVKLLGAALRIPLTNKLGDGIAYYNVAYTIYAAFLVLSTAGIPVAISRMVSERNAVGNYRGAQKVFTTALQLMAVIGALSFGVSFLGAELFSAWIKIPEAALAVKAIAPALCLVPLLSAFRGYFQGQQNMIPTAVSEVWEQIVRVVCGLWLAFFLFDQGKDIAAAGAAFGAAAGALAGILVISAIYLWSRRKNRKNRELCCSQKESTIYILKKIAWISVPIIIGAEIMPLMSVIDTTIIVSRLQSTGWTGEEALGLYSQYGAFCDTLISLPQTFTQAIAISMVPSIAAFFWQRRMDQVGRHIKMGMRLTMILACPSAVGLFVLAKPILLMLFWQQAESAVAAVPTLRMMTMGIILLAMMQTTTGALQSIDKQTKPVRNLAVGAVIKGILTYILVGIPVINVNGAAIGTNAAYFAALMLNLAEVRRTTGVKWDVISTFIKPAAASAVMGLGAYGSYSLIGMWLNTADYGGNAAAALAGILSGVMIYGILVVKMGIITEEELRSVPFGEVMIKIFRV